MADTNPPSIFDIDQDESEETRLDDAADAEIEAGRFVTHDQVRNWLLSWGTHDEKSCPEPH